MQSAIKRQTLMDSPLGEALVRRGIITRSELDAALRMQKERKSGYLGEILQELGVSQRKISETLDYLNKRKKIGEILIDLGVITVEGLERALKEQKAIQSLMGVRRPLGILLFQMGMISYRDYMMALSKHFVLPIISLEDRPISASLQRVLGAKYIRKHGVLVLKDDGYTIEIALGEPTWDLIQEIRKSLPFHKEIVFYLAHPIDIDYAHKRIFDPFALGLDR